MTVAGASNLAGANPFVGPRPIEQGREIFGRGREIDELYYLLSAERVVLFHSPSGAGKSSLIQAGLIPRLARLFDVWGPARVNVEAAFEGVNRYAASAIASFEEQLPEARRRPPEETARLTLTEYVAGRPRRKSAPGNIVLIFDQFEEILTAAPLDIEGKRGFFQQLGALLQDPKIWALFALRDDYLAPLDPYARAAPTHLKNRFRLDLLSRESAAEAIAMRSSEQRQRVFAPAAVDKLVDDLATMQVQQPDGAFERQRGPFVEPMHLQVVCRRLWDRMPPDDLQVDPEDVEAFGDVTGALSDYYSAEVENIAGGNKAKEREVREWTEGKLITPGGTRGQVLRGKDHTEGLDNASVAQLVHAHLVRGEHRAGAQWYELAHDRMIGPVKESNHAWFETKLHKVQKMAAWWESHHRPEMLIPKQQLEDAIQWEWDMLRDGQEITATEGLFVLECRRILLLIDAKTEQAERERRQTRRFRRLAIAACAVSVLALGALGVAWAQGRKAKQAAAEADSRRLAILASQLKVEQTDVALLLALEAGKLAATAEAEVALPEVLEGSGVMETFGIGGETTAVAFSGDERWFAAGRKDGKLVLRDLKSANDEIIESDGTEIIQLEFSGNSELLAWTTQGNPKRSYGELFYRNLKSSVRGAARTRTRKMKFSLSHDGTQFAIAGGVIEVREVASGKPVLALERSAPVAVAAYGKLRPQRPDEQERAILTGALRGYGGLAVWDAVTGKRLADLNRVTDDPTLSLKALDWEHDPIALTCSPAGSLCASGGKEGKVILWDLEELHGGFAMWKQRDSGAGRRTNPQEIDVGHRGEEVTALAFSPNGDRLASGGSNASGNFRAHINVWDLANGFANYSTALRSHEVWGVTGLAFSANGTILASSSPRQPPASAVLSNRKFRAMNDWDVVYWDAGSERVLAGTWLESWKLKTEKAFTLSYGSGGVRLAHTQGGNVEVWDVINDSLMHQIKVRAFDVQYSADGSALAVIDKERRLQLWNADGSAQLAPKKAAGAKLSRVAFAGVGERVFYWDAEDRPMYAPDGDLASAQPFPVKGATQAVFSRDGRRLAFADGAGQIGIWDTRENRRLRTLNYNPASPGLAFSPDGTYLAVAGDYNAVSVILLWDSETGVLLRAAAAPESEDEVLVDLAFSGDGSQLASLHEDGTVQVWESLSAASWKDRACRIVHRNLCQEEWAQYMGSRPYELTCPKFGPPPKAKCR